MTMGTYYLLFSRLPFDFDNELPIDIGGGVSLCRPDPLYELIVDDLQLQAILVPHELARRGQCHVALCRELNRSTNEQRARQDIYLAWYAMRLASPVPAATSGCAVLVGGHVEDPRTDSRNAVLSKQPVPPQYDAEVLGKARRINLRVRQLSDRRLQRARSALVLFSHVDIGRLESWQLTCIALFSVLECVFPQPRPGLRPAVGKETYGERLGRRVQAFLEGMPEGRNVGRWIARNYDQYRNPLAHGFHPVGMRSRMPSRRVNIVQRLHSVCRTVLLGMIGLDNQTLADLLPVDAGTIVQQDWIDALPTRPNYDDRQIYWR